MVIHRAMTGFIWKLVELQVLGGHPRRAVRWELDSIGLKLGSSLAGDVDYTVISTNRIINILGPTSEGVEREKIKHFRTETGKVPMFKGQAEEFL